MPEEYSGIATEELNQANTEFYRAFERLSVEEMGKLWRHDENVICIHPGWDLFTGWLAVRESWATIFGNTEMIRFTITNTKVKVFDKKVGVVACVENIETTDPSNGMVIRMGAIATNVFEKNETSHQWLLIHHHGSPVTNYMPPNMFSQ